MRFSLRAKTRELYMIILFASFKLGLSSQGTKMYEMEDGAEAIVILQHPQRFNNLAVCAH